jgi:hypothetical protein
MHDVETDPNKLTLVLATPSLMGAGPAPGFKLAPWSTMLRTQVLISTSLNSSYEEPSGQLVPRYNHVLVNRCLSGRIRRPKNVYKRCMLIKPSCCNYWMTLCKGYILLRYLFPTPYPSIRLGTGVVTGKHEEQRVGVVPHREPLLLPPFHQFGHGDVEVKIDTLPGPDWDIHTPQNC